MSPPDVVVELGDLLKGNRYVIFFFNRVGSHLFFFFLFFTPLSVQRFWIELRT